MTSNGTNKISEKLDADVIVVGAGGAGLAAAIAAAEKGAKVIVVEKIRPGGSSAMAKGFFGVESPVQKREMIDAPRDLAFKIAMNYGHLKIDPRIIRAFVDKSGDTVSWLERKGAVIDFLAPLYPNQYPLTWHVLQGGGAQLIEVLTRCCREIGVKVLTDTAGKEILRDGKNHVTGLLVKKKGVEFRISAKSIILATGGYGGNKTLLKKYCPIYHEGIQRIGAPNMGDGLKMALSAGAATEGLGVLHLAGPAFSERAWMTIEGRKVLMPLAAVGFEPYTVWINKRGERFIDETAGGDHFESANAVVRQPDMTAYMIIDSAILEVFEVQGLVVGQGKFKELQRRGMPGLGEALKSAGDKGKAKVSGSWDEIALWIGAEPQSLKNTINEYNRGCERGYDPVFSKERRYLRALSEPPYYVMPGSLTFLTTIGGIRINHRMEVVDKEGDSLPGVYAAGADAGGWTSDSYCGKLAGSAFGFALNSGRIAGENAAIFGSDKGKGQDIRFSNFK